MTIFKYELGARVKDLVTGFQGVITGRSQFLNLCIRYGVQSDKLKDGIPTEAQFFDEEQLTPDAGAAVVIEKSAQTGGPHEPVRRRADATR